MNTANNEGPQPWIDPALEARVVAGVLGETSAFEAAELDRVLAENPELAIFKRRIEAVHALVGVATRSEAPKIQLSPDCRQKLLEKLGARPRVPKKKVFVLPRPIWWSSRNLIAVAASLVIGAMVVTFFGTMVVFQSRQEPPDFEGESGGVAAGVAVNVPPPPIATMAPMSGPVFSSSTSMEHQVAVLDGQTTVVGGLLKNDGAPVAGKPMDFAMNDGVPAEKERALAENAPTPTSVPAPSTDNYGTPVPGKPGFVTSPHSPYAGYVDVRGFPPGTEVKDPYTGKSFVVNGDTTANGGTLALGTTASAPTLSAPVAMATGGGSGTGGATAATGIRRNLVVSEQPQQMAQAEQMGESSQKLAESQPALQPAPQSPASAAEATSLGLADSSNAKHDDATPGRAGVVSGKAGRATSANAIDALLFAEGPASESSKAAASADTEKQWPEIQQGRNSQQGHEYAESKKEGNQPQTMVTDQLVVGQERAELGAKPTRVPLPAGTVELRDSSGKFEGYVQYGAPISANTDVAATGMMNQPVFTAAPSAPQAGDKLSKAQMSAVTHFSRGWGKASGSGTDARGDIGGEDRQQSAQTVPKDQVAVDSSIRQSGATPSTDWDSAYMFRGVNVLSQGADNNARNNSSGQDSNTPPAAAAPMELAKAKSSDREEKQRVLNQSKGTNLVSNLEVTTRSGQRATVGIVSESLDPARDKADRPTGLTLAGAGTYSGATTVSNGSLAMSGGVEIDADKKVSDNNTAAAPVMGDLPLLGRAFSPKPAKDSALAFRTELQAAKQPFSTFSLHVSDVSFQLAKDALTRGATPDPDRIRAEEFYNAFDYGDPAPAPGEEVACRIEQCAHPFLQQRDLVRIALKVAAAGRAAGQPLRLTILLDTSGSMEREDRAASVRRALGTLATLLGPNDRVTLIGFARTPRLLAEQVPGDQANKLVEIAARTPSEGGTNLEMALALASELALKQKLPTAQNRIVLLTDGAANLGDANPAQLARQIEKTRQQGISFDACGVGANGLNDEILEALTRKGDGRYYFLNRPEDADAGFARQLAGALRPAAENVKVQVVFNPARVSQYRLIGFEKHLLKKEDFRNDKVQAAELSAEEAGVAVYQVQTLPEGDGELGEVFVRFRDPANGQMIEHSWTMPYDAKAPAFDKAAPSMQLAVTAALLAEKLRGDSQADLNALAPVITNLRGQYSHQAKVADLIRMFEKVRQ